MATEAETKETISEGQLTVQGLFYEALHPDAVRMFDSSKGTILYATPIDSQLSFKESVSQHVSIVSEELTSKGNHNEVKDEKVSAVKEQLVSEIVDGNVTMDEETTSDESTCNKVDAQAEEKQDEVQGGTDREKLGRVNEEPSIKLENETKSVSDASTAGTDSIPGAEPSQNENSREPVGMMTKEEIIVGSPLHLVNEKQEVEKLDRVDEESHAKIKAGTEILNDERINDTDSMLVEEPSKKGNTQEPPEITAKKDFEPTKDEPEHGALESSLSAVHDEPEEFERVSKEKNAKIDGEAGLFDDERDNHADSILVEEKENKQEPIDVAAISGLERSEDVPEHDKLENSLDAIHEDLKGLKGKCEIETISKEELIVNVEERSLEDEKKCEPIEKAASELPTVPEAPSSETSSETLAANKTNEKNTDDEVKETTEGYEMHEAATGEEMSRNVGANIDQTVQETKPENLEKAPETMLKDQSSKKLDDAENTNFDIPEGGVSLKIEIDTLCTSKAAFEEHMGKTKNMEETSEQDQPDEKNETVRDNDTQNDKEVVKHEESHNSVCEDQDETISSRDDTEISEFNQKASWEHELVSELAPEQRTQEAMTGTENTGTEKSNFDKRSSKEVSEMVEPNDEKENAKNGATLNKDLDECPNNRVSVEETTQGEVGQNNGEGPSTTSEVQIHQATYTKGIKDVYLSEEERETEQFKVISESLGEEKYQKQTGESDTTKIDKSIDDDSPNMMKQVSVVANLNEDAEAVKESTEASLHAVKGDHSESRTVIVPVLPDQIGEQEDAPKNKCDEQIYEATKGKSNIDADTHEEKADSEELEVITASVLNDHKQEDVKPKETENPDHMDNLDEANPEITDYNDDNGTITLKDEDVREKATSGVSRTRAFVAEEAGEEVGKKDQDDHQITKTENDKEAAVQEEKENLDIKWEPEPEIKKGDMCETENAKIDKALSPYKDTNGSDVRVDIASDETSRLALEETMVENNHAVKSDDKLESSNVFETGEEEVLKKEESVESIIASRSVHTNSTEVIRENQIEGKVGAPVTVNSELVGNEEKQKLEEAITEVASGDQSKEIYSADGNRKNGTTIEEISEMVKPNEDKENINEAKENKDLDEHTVPVQKTLKEEEGQKNAEVPCSVNEDQIHQPTYTEENIDVDISETERETDQFKVIPESLPEDNWKKEIGVFDAIKIDSSTNGNNPNPTISVVANPNGGIEIATENETNLNTDKEDHSSSQKMNSLVVSDKIGEHENTSTECKKQIYKANDDGSSIEVDIHNEKAHSEEFKFILESVPKDCTQENVTEPKDTDISDHQKAADISDHSDDLEKETPEISSHSEDPETAKVKDEDVLEKGIGDVSNTQGLVAEAACDGVNEKHEDAHQIKNTEDNKEAALQKDEENIDINMNLGPEDQRQGAVCDAEKVKVELVLNIDKDDKGSAIAENASEATSGLTSEETLEEKNYKLEYDDKPESDMLKNREEKVPIKEEIFDVRLGVSSNVVSKESIAVEGEQLSQQITEKEEETNRTVEEAKVAELVPQPDISSTDDTLYTNEASLDKKMQNVSVSVDEKTHSAEEDDGIKVWAILENQIKNEEEIHISLQNDETEDNQHEKENETGAEQRSYESSDAGETIENESFKDKDTAENNSEKEKLEDRKPEMSPIVVLEDFETATGAKDIHESETYKQGTKNISEEIIQKAEDMMLTESAIELEPGNQINSSIHTTDVLAIPSKEALKAEALGACPEVSSNSEINEHITAEVEHSLPQLTDKEQVTNGTDKEAKDADMVSQTDIKTMGDTLHANEDSCDMNTQDASIVIEKNIQKAQDDSTEVSADSNNETKEEKDAHTSLIKEDLKDMPQEKEIQTEQGSYNSSEACETNEYQSFRYKETAEDISRDIVEDQDPEKLPHVIRDLETAIETKVIHESEMGKQSTENNNKDEDMIRVQSVAELEHDNQNNKPIPSAEGPIPSAEALKEEVFNECIGVSSNTSCEDHTAAEVEHFSQQITEKEEAPNGTDDEVNLRNAKENELISRTAIEIVSDSLCANETFQDKNMQDASAVVEEIIQSLSEGESIQIKGVSENENKEKPGVQTSIQENEQEEKKHKKDDKLTSRMGMETTGESFHANKASHDKNMQDALVVVDEKIHSSSEDKSIETMGVPENENKEEPDVKTSIQNDEPKDKKQEKDDELISRMDMEIVGDSLQANEASHDQNRQHASVTVEEKIQSSLEYNSTEITGTPEKETKEEPEDKKQEKDDELTSQTNIETAGDSICAKEMSLDKNMQDATEAVEEKMQSSSKDMNKERMSISKNENKEYLDVQAGIQKDEPEDKKQEKENEIQAEQKCNEPQDESDTIENESLKEKVIVENISQNEMADNQEAIKLPHVVHEDLEITGDKAIDVTETEQEGAANKNEENVQKCEDVIPVESVTELEHGNQSNSSIYPTEEAPFPSEEGESSGDGLSETTMAKVEHVTQEMTEEEEETNDTSKEAKQAELLSQMDMQKMKDTSSANEASIGTNAQDVSVEIEEKVHNTEEDRTTEVRSISESGSNEQKDVHTILHKEELEDKPLQKENEIQEEQETNESNEASEKYEESFKDKEGAENYSEKENLEVEEPMKSTHVVEEDPETATGTEDIHESETEIQSREYNNENNFQKIEDMILVEPTFKLEPDNQDNKSIYTEEGDIPDEETSKVFDACIEETSNIKPTEPTMEEVEHLSQQMTKKKELIDEEAKEIELAYQVHTESMGDALHSTGASLSKNMQDASIVVEEKIFGTPEDNSSEVRVVSEEQSVHTVLQKEELQHKPIEKENEIQIKLESYESCDVNETIEKENFEDKESAENRLEKEILEDQKPGKFPHVMDEDPETTRTEGIHESEADKKGTENNSEEYFQKADNLMIPELASGIETGNQNNNSIYTTEIKIPSEETKKDEVFYACQGISSNTGTSEPTIGEVEHLPQQIIDKHETSNGTDEEDKEVELASEMNTETRSVPYLQAKEASIDKNLQDSSLVVEERIQSSSEDGSIEVTAFSKNENKEEQDVEKSLQEDVPQDREFEIQAEQKSYEVSNASETIENESLKEKATAVHKSEKEKLEDQESESPNVVHEDSGTTIGTDAIHESETEKQVTENNNEENFLKDEDMMFAESVTELDTGNEINKSIHNTEPEIRSEETLKEEVFDACQQSFFNTKLGKPIVAEIEHLSQDMATKEAATNGTNEVDKNGVIVSQMDIEPTGDNSCSDEVLLEKTMQDTSKVVEENISMSEDNRILVRAIFEDENKEEHAVHTNIQKVDLEVKPQEKENKIHTEQKSYKLPDASETYGSSKEKETVENNSENEKLEDQEPEKSSQMVLEDLDTANETEDIHGSETDNQDTESVIELDPDNTNNNSIHCTEGVTPIEEKTSLIDDVAKVDVHNERNRCNMVGDVSVTHELIEESKHMEQHGPILQKDGKEIETHQKAEQSASTVTQNEVIADGSEIVKLQKNVNEVVKLDASSDTLLRNQDITIEKSIVFEEDTIEAVYEQILKDESEAKKDELATDSVPNNQVKENDCQSLKQTTTMMDSSGNLGTSSVVTSLVDETEKEVDEKFSKISDYWPARYNEEASNVNAVDREHQKEITSVVGQPSGIEKFTFTSDSTDASKLDACKEGREMLNEVSNLVSKEKEIDEKICSSTVLTDNKENPHEQSAMQGTEVIKPVVMGTEQVINNASDEVKFDNLQKDEHDLPVSQFLMKQILGEEGDTLNKTCEEECEDVTNKRDERDKENEAKIPKQEEISKREDNGECKKLQNSYKSAQTEESGDAMDNSDGTVVKDEVSLQSTLDVSKSNLAVIEDENDEIAIVLAEKSVHTATDDSMELVSTEKRIPEIKLDGKPCNETDLAHEEKIQASIFEETITEKDIQKDILQKESGEESKEQPQSVENAEVSEDKIREILATGSDIVECQEEKQDVGTQILILKDDSEEELKLSKSQGDRQTDLGIESTIDSLKRDGNLMEDKNLAVMVETTDDKGDVNETDEQKYRKDETDEQKPGKSGNDGTTVEATDSELKPIQTDDQTKKSSESSITDNSKLNETLGLQSKDKNEEGADKKQDVIDQNQGQTKNGMTEELKLSDLQIVQQSDISMDEDHSVLTTESKVDEDKTDGENDEEEEEDTHKPQEPSHDAAVIVEARDAEVTPTKKKSHGILSGVGSKVKHSIAKVKKAITGKSSHSKTPPAK